jgi:hypothetical protein
LALSALAFGPLCPGYWPSLPFQVEDLQGRATPSRSARLRRTLTRRASMRQSTRGLSSSGGLGTSRGLGASRVLGGSRVLDESLGRGRTPGPGSGPGPHASVEAHASKSTVTLETGLLVSRPTSPMDSFLCVHIWLWVQPYPPPLAHTYTGTLAHTHCGCFCVFACAGAPPSFSHAHSRVRLCRWTCSMALSFEGSEEDKTGSGYVDLLSDESDNELDYNMQVRSEGCDLACVCT